jgi:hypothetical protein
MSNDLFANSRHQQGASREEHARPVSPESDDLPLILAKAEEERRSRLALKRMGYLKVRSAYLRYKRDGKETFHAFGAEHLWPTMDFVRDWLRQERRRLIAQAQPVFLVSLLATLAVGFAFWGALALFG